MCETFNLLVKFSNGIILSVKKSLWNNASLSCFLFIDGSLELQ